MTSCNVVPWTAQEAPRCIRALSVNAGYNLQAL